MYKNQFLAIIKKDGKPLRELGNQFVHLPFDSEYSIELRNDHWQRAIAKIYIDGTEVVQGGIVVNAQSSVNLERFVLDENLDNGNKFKFVSLASATGADPTNLKNGVVRVEFWLEKTRANTLITWTNNTGACNINYDYYTSAQRNTSKDMTYDYYSATAPDIYKSTTINTGTHKAVTMTSMNINNNIYDSGASTISSYANFSNVASISSNVGVTSEGGASNQKFVAVSFGDVDTSSHTIIELTLRGAEVAMSTSDKVFCTQCGKKIKPTYSFCPHCGERVQL